MVQVIVVPIAEICWDAPVPRLIVALLVLVFAVLMVTLLTVVLVVVVAVFVAATEPVIFATLGLCCPKLASCAEPPVEITLEPNDCPVPSVPSFATTIAI